MVDIIGSRRPVNPAIAFQNAREALSHSLLTPAEQQAVQAILDYVTGLEAVVLHMRSRLANEPSTEDVNRLLAAAVTILGNPATIKRETVEALPVKMHLDVDVAEDFYVLTVKNAGPTPAIPPQVEAPQSKLVM